MKEKQFKDTIVAQAIEIAGLKEELRLAEYFRKFNLEQLQKAEVKIAELKEELANIPMATLESTDDDIGMGMTD